MQNASGLTPQRADPTAGATGLSTPDLGKAGHKQKCNFKLLFLLMIYLTVCPSICVLPSLQVFPPVLITWVQQLWARDDWYFHHSRSISQQSWGSPSCNSFTSSYFQQFLICSSPFPGIKNARQGQVSEQQGSYQEHGSFPMQPKDSKGCGLVLWTQNSCSACAEAFMFVTCCCHL